MSGRYIRSMIIKDANEPFPENPALGQMVLEIGTNYPLIYIYTNIGWVTFASSSGAGGETTHDPVTLNSDLEKILSVSIQRLDLDSQAANTIFAGPTGGSSAPPTFRSLVNADFDTSLTPTFTSVYLVEDRTITDLHQVTDKKYVDDAVTALGARYYMTNSDSGVETYKLCSFDLPETNFYLDTVITSDNQLIGGWISEVGEQPEKLLAGVYNWNLFMMKTAGGTKTVRLYWELIERDPLGSETKIATSSKSDELDTAKTRHIVPLYLAQDYEPASDSRIVGKIYASLSGNGGDPTVRIYGGGDDGSCWEIPVNKEIFDNIYVNLDGDVMTGALTVPYLKSLSTTEQLRLSYDASKYAAFTVDSSGDLTVAPSGGVVTIDETLSVLNGLDVDGAATFGDDLTVGPNIFFVDYSQQNIGVNCAPDPQFDLDIGGNLRAQGWIVGKHAIQLKDALMICHFDGPEPYETDFTGNATGHMGRAPTISGGVIFRPGKFLKAVQIAEATINLVKNQSFEYDAPGSGTPTNWAENERGTYQTSDTTSNDSYIGDQCAIIEIVAIGGTVNLHHYAIRQSVTSNVSNNAFTLQARIKGPVGREIGVRIVRYIDGSPQWNGGLEADVRNYVIATGEWQLVSVTIAAWTGSGSTTLIEIRVGAQSEFEVGDKIYIDAVQVEEKPYVTPYCDGSLGPGHEWSGTPHASTSTRETATLIFGEAIPRDKFTILGWFKATVGENTTFDPGESPGWVPAFLQIGVYFGNPSIMLGHWYTNNTTALYFKDIDDSGWTSTKAINLDYNADEWIFLAITWDGSKFGIYGAIEGDSSLLSSTITNTGNGLGNGDNLSLRIMRELGGWADDIAVIHRALTEDELLTIFQSNAPVFAETSVWHWRSANNLVWADSEGLWARNEDGDAVLGVSGVDGKSWGGVTLDKGDVLIGQNTEYVKWDDSVGSLMVKGTINADDGYLGSLTILNTLTISTDGEIVTSGVSGYSAGTGLFIDYNSGMPRFRVGNPSGERLAWDGSELWIKGTVNADDGYLGDLTISGTLSLSNTGKLIAGSTTDGIVFGYISDGYYLRGLDGGEPQVEIRASDGRLYAGGGDQLVLGADGLSLLEGTDTQNYIKWVDSSANVLGRMSTYYNVSGFTFFNSELYSSSSSHEARYNWYAYIGGTSYRSQMEFSCPTNGGMNFVLNDHTGSVFAITKNSASANPTMYVNDGASIAIEERSTNPNIILQTAQLFVKNGELFVIDENGNTTQISPHDKETGHWVFYSRNVITGEEVRVDMEELVHAVEELTGKQFLRRL